MTKRLVLTLVAIVCFLLVSEVSFATPMTTCSEEYASNRDVAYSTLESCLTHSGGNFAYASACFVVLSEQLAMATVIYEACSLIQSGG